MSAPGLLGPRGAMQRLQELQDRINDLSPRPAGAPSFGSVLSGAIGANAPLDPTSGQLSPMADMASTAAQKYGLDPNVFKQLVQVESGWNPAAVSDRGAVGLTQLMPGTAAGLGVADPYDPAQSLEGGAKYLRQMLDKFGGDYTKALAAYNAGPGAVEKANGVPPYQETIAYVRKILGAVGG